MLRTFYFKEDNMTEQEYEKYKKSIFRSFRFNTAMDMLRLSTLKYKDIAEFTGLDIEAIEKMSLYITNEKISQTDLSRLQLIKFPNNQNHQLSWWF